MEETRLSVLVLAVKRNLRENRRFDNHVHTKMYTVRTCTTHSMFHVKWVFISRNASPGEYVHSMYTYMCASACYVTNAHTY